MANFVVEFPHSTQTCLHELDDLKSQSPDLLPRINWGCMAGKHNGWAMVEAGSKSDVLNMLPTSIRGEVDITEVNKFTPDQIESMHRMAA